MRFQLTYLAAIVLYFALIFAGMAYAIERLTP